MTWVVRDGTFTKEGVTYVQVPGAAAACAMLYRRPHYEGDLEEPRLRLHLRGGPEGALQLPFNCRVLGFISRLATNIHHHCVPALLHVRGSCKPCAMLQRTDLIDITVVCKLMLVWCWCLPLSQPCCIE